MRLEGYGTVDRGISLPFTFDGQLLTGHPGDTLASALMANGVRLVARSFKYHRPRGIMTAGSEEPNALVHIGEGANRVPNVRATVQELYEGLHASSQNAWPNLRHDLLSVNDLAAPFLSAGFYYKTFMWPPKWWEKIYEPAIRRAAGLGTFDKNGPTREYERAFAHCDLLVIGAGPTGLMAALSGVAAGADVLLVDEQTAPGGRLLSEREDLGGQTAAAWVDEVVAQLKAAPNFRIMTRTAVTGAYDQGSFGALERVSEHVAQSEAAPLGCYWRISARAAVLAAGAIERPIAFSGNDRPGVMMAGAVRSYLHRYGVVSGQSVVVFGTDDDAHRTARDLSDAGVKIAGLVDPRPDAQCEGDFPVFAGHVVCGTKGRQSLRSVRLRGPRGERSIAADTLAISGGWNPSVHLACHMNARPVWEPDKQVFLPPDGAVPGLFPGGAARAVWTTAECLADGIAAAAQALEHIGLAPADVRMPEATTPQTLPAHPMIHAILGKGRAWLDFQNDVTVKDVKLAAQEGYASVEHMKRYTTQGMSPDQGKNSNINALAVLADATGRGIPETGTTTYRPPFVPVPLGAMAAGAEGKGFRPQRFTTSHASSVARGAPMVEAGLWYRPSYFPALGESTWREACDREVTMVRNTVGICDVSTLGKIEFRGPDTGAFLDFVYINGFSKLKVGRARYGVMLREDGHIMDDGTTAHLSDDHWVMTTTTAAAGEVMAHLEMVHQCHMPQLRTRFCSTTDGWAQFAVAGPKSRDLLARILDAPPDLPFMGCSEVLVAGVPGRLFRISFSGEHAYELAVPARYGASLYRLLLALAEDFGGGPYGMEALNVMRIEKGFPTHAELHGRTTAYDLNMTGMMSAKKDFVGKAAASRVGLCDPERERLIGLKPAQPEGRLMAGGHLFRKSDKPVRVHDQGYITSAGYSPTLGHDLALGFLSNGPERHGEEIVMVDHLRKTTTPCIVCDPVFFDPQSERARG